jgi:hypothetical protein
MDTSPLTRALQMSQSNQDQPEFQILQKSAAAATAAAEQLKHKPQFTMAMQSEELDSLAKMMIM